jgi:hypothetical protein
MTVKRVWVAFLLGAAVAACSKDTAGVLQTPPPLAGLRYFDAVPDTGYMDFRVVDIVAYAPNTVRAIFRTGGNPQGVTTTFPPPYLSVQAGTRHITAFLDSTDLATASTVMFDTTVTFTEKHNYTFILYGSARAGSIHALVLDDTTLTQPSDTNSTVWVRTLNLASDTTGLGVPDVFFTTAAAPAGTPTFTAPAYLAKTAYQRVTIGALNALLTRTGTLTPVTVSSALPAGVVGTSSVEPIAGALVKYTAMTTLILPRVIPDSISSLTNVVSTVTPPPPAAPYTVDTMFATTSKPHHLATGAKIHIYGASPAAYNAVWTVIVVDATHLKWAFGGQNPTAPASPATGTIVFEYGWKDYPNPGVVHLVDQQPPLTAP